MNIQEAIRQMVKDPVVRRGARVCEVLSVDGKTCNVKALDTEAEIDGVRLQTEDSNGCYYKPAVGSFVVVVPIADFEYVVVMYSALDEIVFLDGSFGGLIKVADLVSKLNAVEEKVNDLISYINSHSHPGNGSPPSPTYSGGTLTETTREDIENTKINHGDV